MEQIIIAAISALAVVVSSIVGVLVRQARKGQKMSQEERDLLVGISTQVLAIKTDLAQEGRERREELQQERERRYELESRVNEHVAARH